MFIRLTGALVLLAMLVGLAFAPQAAVAEGTLLIEPPEGGQGTLFSFGGAGYEPFEEVSFWLDTPTGDVVGNNAFRTLADREGVARWTWRAPEDAAFGTWTMIGFGNTSRSAQTGSFSVNRPEGAPEPQTDAQVEPAEGTFGTEFRFAAVGFAAGEQVSFWASSPNGAAVGSNANIVTADATGRAEWTWRAPEQGDANATPGIWLMIGFGNTSQASAVIRFTVNPPEGPAVPTETSVQPAVGGPGSEFTFTASGFNAGERLSYWITPPDRNVIGDKSFFVTADETGRATWRWTAPDDAIPGTWTMVIFSPDSRVGEQITFVIEN